MSVYYSVSSDIWWSEILPLMGIWDQARTYQVVMKPHRLREIPSQEIHGSPERMMLLARLSMDSATPTPYRPFQ